MVKLVALYKKPEDVEAFLKHYREVHTPLVKKTPGLERLEVSMIKADAFGGEPPYFMMAEMYYRDWETFNAAMKSEENKAAGKDLMSFAKGLVTLLVAEVEE
ncbi:EthD family reductase [Marinithermus hydrothermalis]|uniref:Ethyl tert-butyl ether degradation EthD n=1 Tax=Marinithermus hydrothermalis (strain DSM 14884 / JCM 11576 / T1) TaxID=869210 RepID=F2NK45_MARHT|nr:EthD family reductase [Marinithermus hydrothermalis]AEB12016.1 Ethyl tert-butyl ether degradation EthD [Marinithermus hydrothermalis DSM 14884]